MWKFIISIRTEFIRIIADQTWKPHVGKYSWFASDLYHFDMVLCKDMGHSTTLYVWDLGLQSDIDQ